MTTPLQSAAHNFNNDCYSSISWVELTKKYVCENLEKINLLITQLYLLPPEAVLTQLECIELPFDEFLFRAFLLKDVMIDPLLAEQYIEMMELVHDYRSKIVFSSELYEFYTKLNQTSTLKQDISLRTLVSKKHLMMSVAGAAFDEPKKVLLKTHSHALQSLAIQFEQNLIEARNTFHNTVKVGINFAQHSNILKNSDCRELRKTLYLANQSLGVSAATLQSLGNEEIIPEILRHRAAIANLMGYQNYAEFALQDRILNNSSQVFNFLSKALEIYKSHAICEFKAVQTIAAEYGIESIQPWDMDFLSHRLSEREGLEKLSDCLLLTEAMIIQSAFKLANDMFGLTFKEIKSSQSWHPSVRIFEVYGDSKTNIVGTVYLDLYPRPNKQYGAWCAQLNSRVGIKGYEQIPVVCIVTNFIAAQNEINGYLSHQDMLIFLHEFGHCLQKILCQIDYPTIGGDANVPLDASEFMSQFMEQWGWDEQFLKSILQEQARQNNEEDISLYLQKIDVIRDFQIGIKGIRDVGVSLLDMRLHSMALSKNNFSLPTILEDINREIGVFPWSFFAKSPYSFSHIFSHDFAAGYYSYLYSEMLAKDVFSIFLNQRKSMRQLGSKLCETILTQGSLGDPLASFITFLGRHPSIHSLLGSHHITTL